MATYLTRTPSSAGNRRTWTISTWIKKTHIQNASIFSAWYADSTVGHFVFRINSGDKLGWSQWSNDSYSTRLFRDPSAWYHVVLAVDTTQGTASNRVKMYVNGVQETSFSVGAVYPSQNEELSVNNNNKQVIGANSYSSTSNYWDGSMSHFHFIDGTAYDASAFGETDATTGEWKIKTSPSVTYGTNGFFILKDGNSVTDQSGNSNNFTVASGTLTNTEDNPSNVFATFNTLIGRHSNGNYLQPDWSNGNLTGTAHGSAWRVLKSTLGASSGKYYAEFKWVSDSNTRYAYVGIYDEDDYANKTTGYPYMADMANGYGYYSESGDYWNNSSGTSFGNSFSSSGDGIQGVALDLDNSKLYFSKNGVWQGGGDPSNGTGGISITANRTYTLGLQLYSVGSIVYSANFGNGYFGTTAVSSAGTNASGNGIFEYDVPTGFTALTTKGLNL